MEVGAELTTATFQGVYMTTQAIEIHERVDSSKTDGARALETPEGIDCSVAQDEGDDSRTADAPVWHCPSGTTVWSEKDSELGGEGQQHTRSTRGCF